MNPKLGNDATDDDKRGCFGEYLLDEEALGQSETDIDS